MTHTMNDHDGNLTAELQMQGAESPCPYLPDRLSRFEYRWTTDLSGEQLEALLERGWRRFGRSLFRPICQKCQECRSLRIILSEVQLTKSQRRCRNRNSDVRLIVQPPSVTDEHVRLYNNYHRDMHKRRGWPYQETSADDYYQSFVEGHFDFSREFLYVRDDQLIGVGLVDMTARVQSSVYFIHDPLWRSKGPGTFSVLSEIDIGRAADRDYLYMGYYIRDCESMSYKNRFRPHQFLRHFVSESESPNWDLRKTELRDSR